MEKTSAWSYYLFIGVLGLVALCSVGGIILLSAQGREVPPALPGIAGTALGALTGLFARPPTV